MSPSETPGAAAIVDYARSLDCIHCGLCLHTCPTYQRTGSEASSPRGRVHLMRAVAEGQLEPDAAFAEEMNSCLVCRHCESVCPAGVQFGTMMEITRDGLTRGGHAGPVERCLRWLGFRVLLRRRLPLRLAVGVLGLAQRSGLLRLVAPLLGARGRALASFPRVPARRDRRVQYEPEFHTSATDATRAATSAASPEREQALLLIGCVMPELFGPVHRATAKVLGACGVGCRTATDHVCCGALHAHNGELEQARDLARETIAAFDRVDRGLPIVVNSAGCGAHMREYGRLLADDGEWAERAREFAARVVDFAEFLEDGTRAERLAKRLQPAPQNAGSVTYDDPCHLCHGQGVRSQPRALLDRIPDLERIELEGAESCCGSAGIFSLLRPTESAEMLAPKLAALERSGARTLVTANPGCQLQWQSAMEAHGMEVRVKHLAEVLAERITEDPTAQPSPD